MEFDFLGFKGDNGTNVEKKERQQFYMETVLSRRRKQIKETMRQRALKKVEIAAKMLYSEGAEEVCVFGSVLKPSEFDEHSDVDIAVKGIREEKRIPVIRQLDEVFGEIPFDVVFLEEPLRPEIRERIEGEGVRWRH